MPAGPPLDAGVGGPDRPALPFHPGTTRGGGCAATPGAVVLAEFRPTSGGRFPLLATQKFGRGRAAVFATGGSWRWQMGQDSKDMSHEVFWQQLLRWLRHQLRCCLQWR